MTKNPSKSEKSIINNFCSDVYDESSSLTIVAVSNSDFLKYEYIQNSNTPNERKKNSQIFSRMLEFGQFDSPSPKRFSSFREEPSKIRWIICLCDCFLNVFKYYCMDTPQALQMYFSKGHLHLSSFEYNNFYSIFAYFFIIIFFSGYFAEKISVRLTFIFFSLLIFLGHFCFTIGGTYENYMIMLVGRCFFGIGSFCMGMCQDVIITEWFFDRELALALGLRFTTTRLGSALTMLITPKIMIVKDGYYEALSVGLWLALFGIFFSIIIVFVDWKYEKNKGDIEERESFLKDFSFIENGLTIEKLKDIGKGFWFLVLNVALIYACYFGFVNNSNDILCTLYGFAPLKAGELVTIMYFSAGLTPLFSLLIDRIEKRVNLMILLLFFLMIPYFSFCFLPNMFSIRLVLVNLILIGVFSSSYISAVWSLIPLLIEGKKQCMGFAIISSITNLSLILSSIYVGFSYYYSNNSKNDLNKYQWAFICMVLCLLASFISLIIMKNNGNQVIKALNTVISNHDTRNLINDDPNLGQELLEIMKKESEFEETIPISMK